MSDAGYGIFADVFDPRGLEPAIAALDGDLSTRSRAGARHVLALPAVGALAADPRMLRLADRVVAGARPFRATLFDRSAAANWLVVGYQNTALPRVRARRTRLGVVVDQGGCSTTPTSSAWLRGSSRSPVRSRPAARLRSRIGFCDSGDAQARLNARSSAWRTRLTSVSDVNGFSSRSTLRPSDSPRLPG